VVGVEVEGGAAVEVEVAVGWDIFVAVATVAVAAAGGVVVSIVEGGAAVEDETAAGEAALAVAVLEVAVLAVEVLAVVVVVVGVASTLGAVDGLTPGLPVTLLLFGSVVVFERPTFSPTKSPSAFRLPSLLLGMLLTILPCSVGLILFDGASPSHWLFLDVPKLALVATGLTGLVSLSWCDGWDDAA